MLISQPEISPARTLDEAVKILNEGISEEDKDFFLREFERYGVGNTPMYDLREYVDNDVDTHGQTILIKDESRNLEGKTDGFSGNVKVRFGLRGVLEALSPSIGRRTLDGDVQRYSSIEGFVEATSGSTGTAIAYFAREKGIPCVIFIPENAQARIAEIRLLGAVVKETPAVDYMDGAIAGANNFLRENPRYVQFVQYNNTANVSAHFDTTGVEFIKQSDLLTGRFPDFLVSAGGTSGTVMGSGLRLKHEASKRKIGNKEIGVYIAQPDDEAFSLYSGTQWIEKKKNDSEDHRPWIYRKFAGVVLGDVNKNTIFASNDELLNLLDSYDCVFRGGRSTILNIIASLKLAEQLDNEGIRGKVIVTLSPSNNAGEDYAGLVGMYKG